MEAQLIQEQLLEYKPKTSFAFICKGRVVSIKLDEIAHVSKYGNETVIYMAPAHLNPPEGRTEHSIKSYRTGHSLQEILNDLPVNDFFRVHKSHIISLKHMAGVKKKRIRVGEYYLPVSKYYKAQLCIHLQQILNKNFIFYTFLK